MAIHRTTPHTPTEEQLLLWLTSDLSNWGRWGADDEKGTLNYLDSQCTTAALSLVKEGITVSCARNISYQPASDPRRTPIYYMLSSGDRYRTGEKEYRQVAIDFFGLVFHGHTVTHLDSLAHFFWDGKMYNGYPSSEVSVEKGAEKCPILAAKQGVVTRGILVDVPMLRRTDLVEPGDGAGVDDFAKAEKECGISIRRGDVVLIRTGQLGHRERTGPISPNAVGSAGPLPELLPLLHKQEAAILGSDTGNDVQPSPYGKFVNPVHQVGIVGMGLWILDNAWLDDLAEECKKRKRWDFAISINPLAIPNATGSPVNPIAIF